MVKAKCIVCGEVDVEVFYRDECAISIPVEICPTLKDVGKYYKKLNGSSYEESTGSKLKGSFEKCFIEPSHESFDDVGYEEAKKHILEPIECWVENY